MLKETAQAPLEQRWTFVNLDDVKFDAQGLVPVIAQDARTDEVLMLAWADRAALTHTLETRRGTYFSRSRGTQWVKGESSGHTQTVLTVALDCDGDAVLYRLEQEGAACHTGERSCFHNFLGEQDGGDEGETGRGEDTLASRSSENLTPPSPLPTPQLGDTLERVYQTILERITHQPEGSYVTKMHQAGLDRILKKIPEEAGEVLLAAKNMDKAELALEVADLLFHSLFVMAELGVSTEDLALELHKREGKSGLRPPKAVG